jgi:hypothetical protein
VDLPHMSKARRLPQQHPTAATGRPARVRGSVAEYTLTFATDLAVVKPGAASGAAARQEPNGDESRRGSQSVSAHPINRT